MKPSEFKISISVESYDEKLLKITEIATLLKIEMFLNYQRYRSQILIAQIEDLNEDCVKFRLSIQFIVLIDSASPKTDTKMYFNF